MKRLCIFYYKAGEWVGKPVYWIVCQKCQRKLKNKYYFTAMIFKHKAN